MRYVTWLWRNTRGIRFNTAVRIGVGLGQVSLGLLMVWLSKRFIDETVRTGSTSDIISMVVWLVLIVVGGVVLRQCYYYMGMLAGIAQGNALRLRIFSSLFRRQLFDGESFHSGDVSSRLAKDIEEVSTLTTTTLPQMVVTLSQLFGAFLMIRFFDARLAWLLVLLTFLVVGFGKLLAHSLRQMTLDIRQDESRIQMQVQEGMEFNAVLRSLGSEEWITRRLDNMQEHLRGRVVRRTRFLVITRLLLGCTFALGYLAAFVWGGIQLRAGTITFGVMTSLLQLVGMVQSPILQLLNSVPGIIHATASIDRLEELSANSSEERPAALPGNADVPTLGVRFSGISFRYADGDRLVLKDFSHDFRPGTKTAIMGQTGIGKTTLFRLILGFVQPTGGTMAFYAADGSSVSDSREQLCFVPQGNTLMSGTIRYNLQLAKPEATDEELLEVLHTACADFVLDLPDGLDTELNERGHGLSEGQAQRVAIARGLLRPGSMLLLDEISASLDEATERELYTRLFAAYPGRTMIFITHRSTVSELCDETVRF